MSEQLARYREQLLAAGFREPINRTAVGGHWLFYKPLTNLTAFVVNLHDGDDQVEVVYGCASTAFTLMANDADALISLGISDQEINLRARVVLRGGEDAPAIRAMYDRFRTVEKDELLALAKEKRKAFIREIALRLKPLGFRKTGNTWRREMPAGMILAFNLQKSSYSDVYYFNVDMYRAGVVGLGCYDDRVPLDDACKVWTMDWQLISSEDLADFLDRRLLPRLRWLIDTPYAELGASPEYWARCGCRRTCCEHCWVHKNMWEAKGNS